MRKRRCRVALSVLIPSLTLIGVLLLLQPPTSAMDHGMLPHPAGERPSDGPLPEPPLPYTTFVAATGGEPITLDPHWMFDTASGEIANQIYEPLIVYERESVGDFVGLLAEDWTISPDARVYTFTIRPDITFHAGGTLTPEDVAYAFWRGLLQDRAGGPMWMLLEPLLGVRAIDDYPGDDAAKCQAVKDAVTYDGASGTVTFHLDHAFSPFLSILATQWGAALDKDWMEENGGWGGNCADWRAYHDPAAEESILFDRANGTGPFQLEDWSGGEVVLARHTEYWLTEPLWARGPAGPAALEKVVIKNVTEWEARREMLVSGDADTAYVPSQYTSTLEPFIWERYEAPEDDSPTFVNPTTGTLRLHQNLPTMSSVDLFFVFDIDTSEPNPYIGSGAFDGDGIRPDFFSDLHVRKAFNYAFDWTTFISDTWGGEARQRRGPIPAGLPGFDEAQPTYVYSPTLSRQAFQQAWGGQLWTSGFSMTLAYNTGNDQRRRACEILKQGVESITDTFQVNVVGVPWGEYLNDMVAGRLPAFVLGWHQDYHHPHNWVVPYMHTTGTFASWQGFPVTLTTQFDAKIDACQALAPADATTCYEQLQQMAYDNALDIFLGQPMDRRYQRTEVRGWYHQPALSGPYYYALRKGPAPAIRSVPPDAVSAATYTSTTGLTTTLEVPAGGVPEATVLAYAPDLFVYDDPDGLRFAGRAFALDAYQDDERVPDFAFTAAATVTLSYREGPDEERLRLYAWRGDGWTDAACGPYRRDTADNTLAVPICQLSDFALFEAMRRIYLPVTLRSF